MKKIMLLIVACALLGGCATIYTRAGKTAADFEKDREACEIATRLDLEARGVPDT